MLHLHLEVFPILHSVPTTPYPSLQVLVTKLRGTLAYQVSVVQVSLCLQLSHFISS